MKQLPVRKKNKCKKSSVDGSAVERQTIEQKKRYTITDTRLGLLSLKKKNRTETKQNKNNNIKVRFANFGGNNFSPFKFERAPSSKY